MQPIMVLLYIASLIGQSFQRELLASTFQQILHPVCAQPYTTFTLRPQSYPIPEVMNGDRSTTLNFPFIVSLQVTTQYPGIYWHFCAGVLIKADTVLTAAHCVDNVINRNQNGVVRSNLREGFFVALNPYCRHQAGEQGRIKGQDYIIHEAYSNGFLTWGYDIAIVRLASSFNYTGPFPTLTSTDDDVYDGLKAVVAGWGYVDGYEAIAGDLAYLQNATYLRQTFLQYVPDKECKQEIIDEIPIDVYDETMICFRGDRTDTCKADSGGPIISFDYNAFEQKLQWTLLGLSSFGLQFDCSTLNKLAVFARISSLFDWIQENLEILENFGSYAIQEAIRVNFQALADDNYAQLFQQSIRTGSVIDCITNLDDIDEFCGNVTG
eukprot:TRINITY_DN12184_c0_g1_i2.p1 TRINITY_DN12184_c0_g1~~TRINITY_DN12184_c0_g1_i2.p1  ORF type:complete len:380 (-),score=38.35 TRINITY_DN12184_c0_g1_i2:1449-2588(-)